MSLNQKEDLPYEKIGFRSEENLETAVDLLSIGMEKTNSAAYSWNGMKREKNRNVVFQYTLSGEGAIDAGGKTHRLEQGKAFLLEIPGEHIYYLPETSKEWEFFYITLQGDVAVDCWSNITRRYGHVVQVDSEAALIDKFFEIYQQAIDQDLFDAYFSSSQAYAFLMEMYRHFKQSQTPEYFPANITDAISFMNKNYALPISMEEVAEAAGMSKYYFIKRFKEATDMTPGYYIRKKRIEKSLELLVRTELTMKDIAESVGYANDNYFSKVFRKTVGMAPGEFRKNKDRLPFDRIVIR
ncbi:AraC family transcriptional regulator [Alkalicoccus daliensis]|uniref:AraC-type DNA-binding protein n=1 Tax=Alkalicoccus daliensis TaxID=745820 RepID=A0A1H0F7L6_9BACI|nr:AraC family transcriptional regulator [Alkalicoccus daliensis]SDN90613.1 AraC-type DNA-binding protein [Alkalicoccus daliensis]